MRARPVAAASLAPGDLLIDSEHRIRARLLRPVPGRRAFFALMQGREVQVDLTDVAPDAGNVRFGPLVLKWGWPTRRVSFVRPV
jgi:hypothetical protein